MREFALVANFHQSSRRAPIHASYAHETKRGSAALGTLMASTLLGQTHVSWQGNKNAQQRTLVVQWQGCTAVLILSLQDKERSNRDLQLSLARRGLRFRII